MSKHLNRMDERDIERHMERFGFEMLPPLERLRAEAAANFAASQETVQRKEAILRELAEREAFDRYRVNGVR